MLTSSQSRKKGLNDRDDYNEYTVRFKKRERKQKIHIKKKKMKTEINRLVEIK